MRISRDVRKTKDITASAKCIFPIEQGIQQALIGEYSQKADAAQAISRIAMCKRVGVLEKDVKHRSSAITPEAYVAW